MSSHHLLRMLKVAEDEGYETVYHRNDRHNANQGGSQKS